LLALVAYFHADPRYRLDVGRTMAIGRPWPGRGVSRHLLVALPYPFGPTLEHLHVARSAHSIPLAGFDHQGRGGTRLVPKAWRCSKSCSKRARWIVGDPARASVVA
jgi:hypothetical protein